MSNTKKVLIACLLLASCSNSIVEKLNGKYYAAGSDYSYELFLRKDSSFSLSEYHIEGEAKCEGNWTLLTGDSILLKCNDEGTLRQIERGYSPKRERIVILMKEHKIKIDNVILKQK